MPRTKQRQQLSGWLCLLAGVLHLLALLCPAHTSFDRVRAEYSTGRVVETSYDGLNRPEAIAEGPRLTRYGYDLAGRALLLVSPNGQTSMNSYDRLGRLVDRTLFKTPAMSDGDVLAEFSWSHDALGNVTAQYETWPGAAARIPGVRVTTMGYDDNNRLTSEVVTQPEVNGATPTTTTLYTYDTANNRSTKTVTRTIAGEEPVSDEDTGHWTYTYNSANQLTAWAKRSAAGESIQKQATLTYDLAGNRTSQTVTEATPPTVNTGHKPPAAQPGITTYAWDAQDRLRSVTVPAQPGTANSEPRTFTYGYDYRTRRISTGERTPSSANETRTSIVFSGGLSVAEWEIQSSSSFSSIIGSPTVEYTRGPDMGGGVGGLLYTSRSESASASVSSSRTLRYNLSNGRGDIVAQADSSATLTWTASYEAYGKRTKETGENLDKQRGNSKDEDPTGLLNEGFRYRDIETGVWLSRDPAGFVDGPNLYAYVMQNPWTGWDPLGLATRKQLQEQINTLKEQKKNQRKPKPGEPEKGRPLGGSIDDKIAKLESRIAWIDTVSEWRNNALDEFKEFTKNRPIDFSKTSRGTSIDNEDYIDASTIDDSSSRFSELKSNYIKDKTAGVAYLIVMLRAGISRGGVTAKTLSKSERLGLVYERVTKSSCAKTAEEAMQQMHKSLDVVEDAFSGVPKAANPGLKPDGRMYPVQPDRISKAADGTITATSRGHVTTYGPNGSITVTDRATGQVVFQKAGGGS